MHVERTGNIQNLSVSKQNTSSLSRPSVAEFASATAAMNGLHLNPKSPLEVQVHPVVLFSVIDHHLRRPDDQDRVIGKLRDRS